MRIVTLGLLVVCSTAASAQTACPVGVTAGSVLCGPTPVVDSVPEDAPPPPRPGYWIDQWGAVVADARAGVFGKTSTAATREEALSEATRKCRDGGGGTCEVVVDFKNGCGSVAWSTTSGVGAVATGPISYEASRDALGECAKTGEACRIVYAECALAKWRSY
jgi:hypothetical protein